MNWLVTILGISDESGRWYAFWSGFGSDLGELAVVGGLVSLYRKHNCHVRGCFRVGRHPVDGYIVCAKHHPEGAPSAQDVLDKYNAVKGEA